MNKEELELVNSNVALLDKAILQNFSVVNIDEIPNLQRQGIVTTKENAPFYFVTERGEKYSSIKIKETGYFISFSCCISQSGRKCNQIEISVSNSKKHYNLNCCTASEYRERITEIKTFLHDTYGITVDFSEATYKSLEINKTITIDKLFSEYYRVLYLMMDSMPDRLRLDVEMVCFGKERRKKKKSDYNKRPETIYRRSLNKSDLEVKIYDKKKQLENKYHAKLCNEYLRFEITLGSSEKINDELGTCNVWKLTDEAINKYFLDFINKNVVDPFHERSKERYEETVEILKRKYEPASKTWIHKAVNCILNAEVSKGVPLVLDVKEIIPLLKRLPFKYRQIRENAKKTFLRAFDEEDEICLYKNDDIKYSELIDKLRY